jgi:hypothetical protein
MGHHVAVEPAGSSIVRRFWKPVGLTAVAALLAYLATIMWLVWSAGSFDMSGFDTGHWKQGHDIALAWPVALSALAMIALGATIVAWKRASRST